MKLTLMQRIDSWLGRPLVAFLRLFTPRARSLGADPIPTQVDSVVCAKFVGMGSCILSFPLLAQLRQNGVHVTFWTFANHAELIRASGFADEVLVIRPTVLGFLPSLYRSLARIRRLKSGAFLDLEPTANFTALLSRISGAPVRVGFLSGKPEREALYTHLVALTAWRHLSESCLLMAKILGFPLPDVPRALPRLTLPAEPAALALLPERPATRVVINTATSDISSDLRQWPEESWAALATDLLADESVHLIFTGTPSDRSAVDRLIEHIVTGPEASNSKAAARVRNLAGQTGLNSLAQILRDSDLLITLDTGTMHLAAWTQTPTLALFGPDAPQMYAPLSSTSRSIWLSLPCSPCATIATDKHTRCRDNICMKRIDPRQVHRVAADMLSRNGNRKRDQAA